MALWWRRKQETKEMLVIGESGNQVHKRRQFWLSPATQGERVAVFVRVTEGGLLALQGGSPLPWGSQRTVTSTARIGERKGDKQGS